MCSVKTKWQAVKTKNERSYYNKNEQIWKYKSDKTDQFWQHLLSAIVNQTYNEKGVVFLYLYIPVLWYLYIILSDGGIWTL